MKVGDRVKVPDKWGMGKKGTITKVYVIYEVKLDDSYSFRFNDKEVTKLVSGG